MEGDEMKNCARCGHAIANDPLDDESKDFCCDCQTKFDEMVKQLKMAWIHQRGHPEKKTLYVHVVGNL